MSKIEILEEDLDNVVGGQITYTWHDADQCGTIGIDGNNCLILLDKNAFVSYYNSVKGTMSDGAILKQLFKKGIVKNS